jgi:hypothetical protein
MFSLVSNICGNVLPSQRNNEDCFSVYMLVEVATISMKNNLDIENSKLVYKEKGDTLQDVVLYITNHVLINKIPKWADNDMVSDVKLELRDK